MKRATRLKSLYIFPKGISIHALVKRATRLACGKGSVSEFQSTPSWRGRLLNVHTTTYARWISIHALVKRATLTIDHASAILRISIHALVKRATWHKVYARWWSTYFNPRPREEGDVRKNQTLKFFRNFNPRPREEGDFRFIPCLRSSSYFNPRPREEGDL